MSFLLDKDYGSAKKKFLFHILPLERGFLSLESGKSPIMEI